MSTFPHLTAALEYADRGWHVFPLRPGTKEPDGQQAPHGLSDATTDRAQITAWWSQRPNNGIAVATGPRSGIWALDVDVSELEDKHGDLTLSMLVAENGAMPDTLTQLTPRGGHHLIFTWPTDAVIRNDQSGRIGADLDVRGDGGYICLAPTEVRYESLGIVGSYEFDVGQPDEPVAAPQWLVDLAAYVPPVYVPTPVSERRTREANRPGDRWAADTDWHDLLTPDGWTYLYNGRAGERRWCRPGKNERSVSATTGYTENDNLKVFTSSMRHMGLEPEGIYTKLGYLAATRFDGDHAAASRHLVELGYGSDIDDIVVGPRPDGTPSPALPPITIADDDGPDLWEIATRDTLADILSGNHEPLRPDMLERSDGSCLLYSGKIHSIASEPGAGKSLIALWAVAEQLTAGHTCAWIDWEDNVATAVRRLRAMGVESDAITDRFLHVKPIAAIRGGGVPIPVLDATRDATLVVIDSTGEALAHSGLNQNNDDEVGAWMNNTARALARGGATVLMIDHMVKNKDDQGRFAIGSQRKLAAIDGIAYTVTVLASPALDKAGRLLLKVSKDRHGNYPHGATVAEITVTPGTNDAIIMRIGTPDGEGGTKPEKQLTHLMEKVSRLIEGMPAGMSSRAIEGSIQSRAAHVRTAIRQLVEAGFAEREGEGRHTCYVSTGAYREPSDLDILPPGGRVECDETSPDEVPRPSRPTASPPRPGRGTADTASPASPASPPYGGAGMRDAVRTAPTDDAEIVLVPDAVADLTHGGLF